MKILGLESSCDDTGAAVVDCSLSAEEEKINILSNVTVGQNDFHRKYGGVVPEIAARKHVECFLPVLEEAMTCAGVTIDEIDAIAVTTHPGLIASLFVGVGCAQALSHLYQKPLIGVSHLKAHFFSIPLDTEINYPFIGLLVSGGHTLLAKCNSPLDVKVLGSTLDDACGECFDKVAKHYGLDFPGGPALERAAQNGDDTSYDFPRAKLSDDLPYGFSFSGLKTAVIHHSEKYRKDTMGDFSLPDLAASLQRNMVETLWSQTVKAAEAFAIPRIGICGGVAANHYLREWASRDQYQVFFPQMSLCTDNAAMVAGLGYHYFRASLIVPDITSLNPSAQSFKKSRIL